MSDGFSGFDLVILIITLIIGYRIYSVLGRRTGKEKKPEESDIRRHSQSKNDSQVGKEDQLQDMPMVTGLKKIKLKDKDFSLDQFKTGATSAFETILKGFVSGKLESIKNLVSSSVLDSFSQLVKARENSKQTAELVFFRMVSAEILESDLVGKQARITVKFKSEQTLVVKEGSKIIDGDPELIDEVVDIWTFVRNVNSSSPVWELVQMDADEVKGQ